MNTAMTLIEELEQVTSAHMRYPDSLEDFFFANTVAELCEREHKQRITASGLSLEIPPPQWRSDS